MLKTYCQKIGAPLMQLAAKLEKNLPMVVRDLNCIFLNEQFSINSWDFLTSDSQYTLVFLTCR
jgi:hypothetical protein